MTITDANGCQDFASVTITQPPNLTGTMTDVEDVTCNGACDGSATIVPSGGTTPYSYQWDNGDTDSSATGLCAGTHSITITDANNCDTIITVDITEPLPVTVNAEAEADVLCAGDSTGVASATAGGGRSPYDYFWSTGDTITNTSDTTNQIMNLVAGTYTVTVQDDSGCTATDNVTISQPSVLDASASVDSNVTCYGYSDGIASAFTSGGEPPYDYQWSSGNSTTDVMDTVNTVTGLTAGTYTITVTDDNGCTTTSSVTVEEPPETFIQIPQDEYETNLGQEVEINTTPVATSDVTYEWEPSESLSCGDCEDPVADPTNTTEYTVTMTDESGCTATNSTEVIISDDKIFYIPNAFSPNGDDKNEEFKVYAEGVERFRMVIFDRWGEKLFETDDIEEGWNGTHKGQKLRPATYIYHITIKFRGEETFPAQKGSVTLIR
ncbi:MAG: hypothetical protein BRD50_08690 [Bacteroidetes bacterium SW_11_45_7]|nr:MAG: hypothetical protein BRD50_08690 [Bacteroidetes bacterium SW_11_45_7]